MLLRHGRDHSNATTWTAEHRRWLSQQRLVLLLLPARNVDLQPRRAVVGAQDARAGAFAHEHTDIPPGVTIDEYRRARTGAISEARRANRAARRRRNARLLTAPLPRVRPSRIAGMRR